MVHIRRARWDELPALAAIAVAAFQDDLIYLHFNPLRTVYPGDWHDGFLRTLKKRYVEPGSVVIVAEIETKENGEVVTRLAAYMTATRRGHDGTPLRSWLKESTALGSHVVTPSQAEEVASFRNAIDRSADPSAAATFYDVEAAYLGGRADTIEPHTLAVPPQYQRGGVGRVMMNWAIEQSEAEGVPLIADASKKGIGLYLKIGFRIVGTILLEAKTVKAEATGEVIELPRVEVPVIKRDPAGAIAAML